MRINKHIQTAIDQHRDDGMDFHDLVTWHMLHGVAMFHPDFVLLGYYCRHDEPHLVRNKKESDCGFITYIAGDPLAVFKLAGQGIDFISFRRGFKNFKPSQTYPLKRFAKLLELQKK